MSDQDKTPVTEANKEASDKAKAEKEKWKQENSVADRMSKLADSAAGGTSTGKGLVDIGKQIAAAVNATRDGDGKLKVEQVAKEI